MNNSPLAHRFLILFLTAFAARSVRATSATWNGADPDWSLSSNWAGNPAVVPGTGDTATFGATGDITPAAPGISLLNLNFNATAQPYTLGGLITFDAGGAVNVAAGSAAQSVGAALTFTGNGTITNNAAPANVIALSSGVTVPVAAGSTFTFDGTGATTVTTINTGAGAGTVFTKILKNGPGSVAILNTNTAIAGTVDGDGITINQGTLRIGNQNAAGNRVINLNGGTLECSANNANSQYTRLHVSANSSLFYSNTANQWQVGAGAGVMVSTGTPVLTLDGAVLAAGTGATALRLNLNTSGFTGTWALTNKVIVRLANVNAANTGLTLDMGTGTGTHIVESLATFHDTATGLIRPITIGALKGTATDSVLRGRQNTGQQTTGTQYRIGILGTDTSYAGLLNDGTATNGTADGTGAVQTNGASGIQGTAELVKEGAGILSLTNTLNTYSGGTVLSGGTLAIAGDGSLGAAYDGSLRPFSLIPGTPGPFTALPVATISGGGGSGAAVTVFSSTGANPPPNNTLYLTLGTTALNNSMTGTGYTSNPVVTVTGTGNTAAASVRVKGLLTFDGGTLRTDAAVVSNRAAVLTANNGMLDTNGFDSTFSGVFNGPGGLTKLGAGTLTLSGAGTYAGPTSVNVGSLCLTGTNVSAVNVASGATFAGNGSTTGAVVNNGTITPGCSIGALGTGALTLAPASAVGIEVADWAGGAGAGYDSINAASLDITATAGSPVTINVSELALANFDGTSKPLTLVATTGGVTGFAASKFTINAAGFTSGAGPWAVQLTGNNLELTYTGSASPYDTWVSGHALAGADALRSADPDKDGLTNIAEFGFNSSPVAGTSPGVTGSGGIKAVTGGDALTLTIRVRTGATFTGASALTATKDGVKYTIQGSTDLAAWTADIDEVTPALSAGPPAPDTGWEYRTFRFAATTATAGRAMIRALAEQP